MTARLSADLAVAYVRELSADVRGVAVVAPDGRIHAEPATLAAPAGALVQVLTHGWVRVPAGLALVARAASGHAVVVAAGPHALAGPTALDAAGAAAALTGAVAGSPPDEVPAAGESALAAVRALLEAA